jgi:hypothetical protein
MERPTRLLTRARSLDKQQTRIIYRKLPLNLYELEPESGEDEDIGVDLDLDQVEE